MVAGKVYKDAGADVIFVEAPQTVAEMQRIANEVPQPVVINNIEGGVTPALPLEELHAMGFSNVGFVLTGASGTLVLPFTCGVWRRRRHSLRVATQACFSPGVA